jgi:hypothetical protein
VLIVDLVQVPALGEQVAVEDAAQPLARDQVDLVAATRLVRPLPPAVNLLPAAFDARDLRPAPAPVEGARPAVGRGDDLDGLRRLAGAGGQGRFRPPRGHAAGRYGRPAHPALGAAGPGCYGGATDNATAATTCGPYLSRDIPSGDAVEVQAPVHAY